MWLSKWLDHNLYTSWQNKQWIRKNTWYLKSPIDSYQIERHLPCRFNRICSLTSSFYAGWLTLHLTEGIRSMTRSRGKANANALCLAILNDVPTSEHHVVPSMYAIFICLLFLISFFLSGGQEPHWPQEPDWMRLLAHVQMERAAWFAVCFPYDVGEQASSTQYKLGVCRNSVGSVQQQRHRMPAHYQ